jgi:hypothetical protein
VIIYVAVPVLDGKPYAAMVDSLLAEQMFCQQRGAHLLVDWEIGCSLIGDARNRLTKRFLATREAKAMVFVDADMSWPTGALFRLARSRKDVVGGTYRPKQDEMRFHIFGRVEKIGAFYRVGGLPGGFIKISRRAFEAMAPRAYLASDGTPTRDYFPMGWHRGRYFGEDYGFCRLWRETGGDVWLDPTIQLRHHDGMTVFAGDPKAWLKEHCNGTGD